MKNDMIEVAAATIKVSIEEAKKHSKYIEDINAYYFWDSTRGGISVIINEDGEKLSATSSVSFEKHKAAFVSGRRN